MRRLLVCTLLTAGVFLLAMVAILSNARREDPREWLLFNDNGHFYRMAADGSDKTLLSDIYLFPITALNDSQWLIGTGRRDGASEFDVDLYLFNAMGTIIRQVTRTPTMDYVQISSMSAGRFVFASIPPYEYGTLYLAGRDGAIVGELLHDFQDITTQTWRLDKWILFAALANNESHIYRIRTNGSGLQNLTPLDAIATVNALTLDRQWIIYSVRVHGGLQIYRMHPDGTTVENLTPEDSRYVFQTLSPDGQWIVFRLEQSTTESGIYRMRLDGSSIQKIIESSDRIYDVGWSANGEWLFYTDGTDRFTTLFRVHFQDGEIQEVLSDVGLPFNYQYHWSPDKRWLLFPEIGDGSLGTKWHIYDAERLELHSITDYGEFNLSQIWSPNSQWIYLAERNGDDAELFRIRPTGVDREMIAKVSRNAGLQMWSPVIDLDWNADLLAILGLVTIGGSLCGGYWFSRS